MALAPTPKQLTKEALTRPFGAASRAEMLETLLGTAPIQPGDAWRVLYRLLLWIDRTTGLAHCYESDKAQPGRTWYERSLAFHAWLAAELGVAPADLGDEIDQLFREGTARLRAKQEREREKRADAYAAQRGRFAHLDMPEPAEYPELTAILADVVAAAGGGTIPPAVLSEASEAIAALYTAENNRRNLLGEGFEDALAFIMRRLPGGGPPVVDSRKLLHELPGFRKPPAGEKPRRVDLGIVTATDRRILVSVKWSVRADREEQFGVDFDAYARLEDSGKDWEFVLITNEFDAARLKSASTRRAPGRRLFDAVVHVCPDAVLAAYGTTGRGAATDLPQLFADGSIVSLADWLKTL